MDFSSTKMLLFVAVAVFLFSINQVLGQVCNPPCKGGPYDICSSCASYCPKTCDRPNDSGACVPVCRVNECECAPGFVRAPNGKCIRAWQCPPKNGTIHINRCPKTSTPINPKCTRRCIGGPHDKCVLCGTQCPLTCEQPQSRPCTRDCAINVCRCEQGFVRGPGRQCIRPHECPNRRPPLAYSRR